MTIRLGKFFETGSKRRFVSKVLGRSTYIAILLGCTALAYRPLTNFLRRMEGHVILLDENIQSVSIQAAGETARARFSVTNVSDRDVVIYGVETTCGCATVSNLPLTVPVGQRGELVFDVATIIKETRSRFSQDARLFVEPASPPVMIRIDVNIAKPAPIVSVGL
jgi:hypothetical protein